MKVEKIPARQQGVGVVDTGVPVVSFKWDGPYIRMDSPARGHVLFSQDEVRKLAKELLEWLGE